MDKVQIHNLAELQSEIRRLKMVKKEQGEFLSNQYALFNHKIETPMRVMRSLKSNVPGLDFVQKLVSKNKDQNADWLTKLLRLSVPFVMNKFLLRKSSVFKKTLMLLISERAIGQINVDSISSLVGSVSSLFSSDTKTKKKKSKKKAVPVVEDEVNEYVIPSYSETY